MVRLSDIIKRKEDGSRGEATPRKERAVRTEFPRPGRRVPQESGAGRELSDRLYEEAVGAMTGVMAAVRSGGPVEAGALPGIVDRMANSVVLEGSELARLALVAQEGEPLAVHSVNVAILAMMIGDEMKLPKTRVTALGLAGLLADVGMARRADVVTSSRKLGGREMEEMKKHVAESREILARFAGCETGGVIAAVEQHHERCDGGGYPKGLRADEISLDGQVVGLADVYEALTHDRPHRGKFLPYAAMKDLAGTMRGMFGPEPMRALIARVAIYPAGSYVELSTNEIAGVYTVNREAPLRPIVDVVLDSRGRPAEQIARIDLRGTPTLYIRQPVNEKDLGDSLS